MIEKLNALEKKYEELHAILADPAVIADQAAYQKHAKAHRGLHEIIEKFSEYKEVLHEIEEHKEEVLQHLPDQFKVFSRAIFSHHEYHHLAELQWLLETVHELGKYFQ